MDLLHGWFYGRDYYPKGNYYNPGVPVAGLTTKLPWELAQPLWASQLSPVLKNPMNNMSILTGVKLVTGDNVINHLLGAKLQGWTILDIDGASDIYRNAPLNNLTLTLNSSAPVTVTLGVF